VGIVLLVVAVGDDHLRSLTADDLDQAPDGLVEVGVDEGLGVAVLGAVGHAGVPVAEQHHVVVADDLRRAGQLAAADVGEVGPHLGPVHRRVEDVAGLAAGARHQHRVDSLVVVAGHRPGPFRGFVVGMGVNAEQAQSGVSHRQNTLSVDFGRAHPPTNLHMGR
jgi:hypothetical protein